MSTCLRFDDPENFVHHFAGKLNALKYPKLQFLETDADRW